MAIPDWVLMGVALAATLMLCVVARTLAGRSRRAAVVLCIVAGLGITPAVVFAGFRMAGSIVGTHNSRIGFLAVWLLGIGMALAFARACSKHEHR